MSESSRTRFALTMVATSAASESLSPKRISSTATVSFSLTTGTAPSDKQPLERVARVKERFAVPGVVTREQHLPDGHTVLGEERLVRLDEDDLTDRRRGLQARHVGRVARLKSEPRNAGRDRAGGDEHDLCAARARRSATCSTRMPRSRGRSRRRRRPASRNPTLMTMRCGSSRRPFSGFDLSSRQSNLSSVPPRTRPR